MKILIILVLCIIENATAGIRSGDIIYQRDVRVGRGSSGLTFEMYLTREELEKQPRYDPARDEAPPLTIQEASRLARTSLKDEDKSAYVGDGSELDLIQVGLSKCSGRWFYVVSFSGPAHEHYIDVIVLFSGACPKWVPK